MKKIIVFVSINLVIGNAIAWFMGAAPIDFPVLSYSPHDKVEISELKLELTEFKDDIEVLTQLGALYTAHNELELAQYYLDRALDKQPNNALALAVSSANSAKQSGAMLDFSMGLFKIYSLWNACEGLNRAVALAPDNFEVRTYRLATFAAIGGINRYFEAVFSDELWFKDLLHNSSGNIPLALKQQFYLSMTSAYLHAGTKDDIAHAKQYFELFEQGGLVPALQDAQVVDVRQRLGEVS